MLKPFQKTLARRFLDAYKARKQRTTDLTLDHALDVTWAMLKRTKYGFLITRSLEGGCSARLVQPIVDDNEAFVLWIGTSPASRKVREIEVDGRATFAIEARRENANLVLYGTARIERGGPVRRQRWLGAWRLFFPDGPTGDDYVVIRFEAKRVELMNFRRNVIAEPFGLRPLVLHRGETWTLAAPKQPAE